MNHRKVSTPVAAKKPSSMLRRTVLLKKTKTTERTKTVKATGVEIKSDVAAMSNQVQDIKQGHKEIKDRIEENEFGCNKLKMCTKIIASEQARNESRLVLMFAILKAHQENKPALAAELARSLKSIQ